MNKMKAGYWVWMFILLGLALYQIILIFWESPTEKESGIWYSMAQSDTEANMLRPDELYFTLGGNDGSYAKVPKQDEDFEEIFLNAYDLLAYVLKNGNIVSEGFEQLPWEREACVLNYGFAPGSDLIMEQIGMEEEPISGGWSEIWVLPAQNRQEKVKVYMLDKEKSVCLKAEYAAWNMEQNQQLLVLLHQKESALSKDYLSVEKWWPEQNLQGDYVLENSIHETAYQVSANVTFLAGTKLSSVQAKNYALRFFQYPDTVTIKEDDAQILYNNEKITVKLDETGLIQYVETLTEEEEEPVTMREAYQLAVGFVKADLGMDETYAVDFTFADYEVTDDQYVFYFNYLISGIPYQMAEERIENWRLEYPIRVTVEGSKVRRYERFVLNFDVEADQQYTLNYTWQEVMDEMASKGVLLQGIPELKYYLEGSKMVLYWVAETKTENSLIPAY